MKHYHSAWMLSVTIMVLGWSACDLGGGPMADAASASGTGGDGSGGRIEIDASVDAAEEMDPPLDAGTSCKACDAGPCDQVHMDCDPTVPGCETLIDKPMDCGGCGVVCSAPNGCKATCDNDGRCTFACY